MRARFSNTPTDPRSRQTRTAIVQSFNSMVLARPFERIQVADVAAHAGVGRSTFYEHFRNIDDLLAHAANAVLGPLADAVGTGDATAQIDHVLDHFRANLARSRQMTSGRGGEAMGNALADLIASRLERQGRLASPSSIPVSLAASLIAGAQLGLIREWLHSTSVCEATVIAQAIRRATTAIVKAVVAQGSDVGA